MKKILSLMLAGIMTVGLLAGCGTQSTNETQAPGTATGEATTAPVADPVDMTLTVWGPQEDQADENGWLPTMCQKFAAEHPEWNITWKYGVCSEGDAGKNVTADPSAAADVYFFANDQLGTLMQANAIAQLGGKYLDAVTADNSDSMIASVTGTDGGVYGVPFTANTWFMYYDKSIFSEEDIKSLDTMLEKGKVAFPLSNSWYLASFYVANGGTLFGDKGVDAAAGIQFGGENGTAVTAYLANLVANPNFVNDADGFGLDGLRNGTVAAIFSGSWDAANVQEALGENFGAAQLPTINLNGEAKQLKAFAGSKAIGVNPNCKNPEAAVALAVYLGSAEAQKAHYEMRQIIPCANSLLTDEAIKADVVAMAQGNTVANTAIVQPSIPEMGAYWTPAESLGKALVNGEITADNAAEKTEAFAASLNNAGL